AHGPAPAADDAGAAAALARGADRADPARAPATDSPPGGGRADVARSAADGASHRATGVRLGRVRARVLDMARGAALPAGAPVARMAPRRARLLRRDGHAVLAARDPGLARPSIVAALDDDPVSAPRRSAKHDSRGHPDVFRPPDLSRVRVRHGGAPV